MKGRITQDLSQHIHPRLMADCHLLGRMPLSWVLLMDDMRYPWFILVPDRESVSEWHELPEADSQQLLQECLQLASSLKAPLGADKVNQAALGNMVPQLHVHLVFRCQDDAAWPQPVWGQGAPIAWPAHALSAFREDIGPHLPPDFRWV